VYSATELSSNEFDVLCFIAHQSGNANITSMIGHPYFKGVSMSTIKRAVLSLTKERLITSSEGDDRRERYLSVVEEVDNV
jgi:DNA-binding MarR family transcriptional regulator